MVHSAIDFDAMRDRLITLDDVRASFASTEPLDEVTFTTGPHLVAISVGDDKDGGSWHKDRQPDEPAPAWLQLPENQCYQLTGEAVQQLGSKFGMPDGYQAKLPREPLAWDLNWWAANGPETELKLMVSGTGEHPNGGAVPLVRGVARSSLVPFSNLAFLDVLLDRIEAKYGKGEVLADYKFHHDLERTSLRLIVPGMQRAITGTSVQDDTWSTGLDFFHSMLGLRPTGLTGYLFRWWCTNGCTDIANTSPKFERRGATEEDALEWARKSVDEILGGLESSFDQVQATVSQPVQGEVVPVLKGLFREFSVSKRERTRILETMADTGGELTMYDLLSAVTMAANIEGLDDKDVRKLLDLGGHIAHSASGTCPTCHQLAPEGFSADSGADALGSATS